MGLNFKEGMALTGIATVLGYIIISALFTCSVVFWAITGVLWICEYNGIVPPGTSASLADWYPFVSSEVWDTPFKQ